VPVAGSPGIYVADNIGKTPSNPSRSHAPDDLRLKLIAEGNLTLDIKVVPRSRVSEISERLVNGALKVKVMAAPERGKANEEVCSVVAAYLGVPKRNVEVLSDFTSQYKRVRVLA
jgi:uncharacterized protein